MRNGREEEAQFAGVEEIAHDGARQDPDRAGPRALDQAEAEQRADRWRERGAETAEREEEEPADQRRLAAEAVGERTDEERRSREAGEEDRDGGGGLSLGRGEIGLDERQTRQRHVDRQRRQRRHRGQKDQKSATMNVEGRHDSLRSLAALVRTVGTWSVMISDRTAPQTLIRPLVRPPSSGPSGHLPPEGEGGRPARGTPLSHREREAAKRQGEGSLARTRFVTLYASTPGRSQRR